MGAQEIDQIDGVRRPLGIQKEAHGLVTCTSGTDVEWVFMGYSEEVERYTFSETLEMHCLQGQSQPGVSFYLIIKLLLTHSEHTWQQGLANFCKKPDSKYIRFYGLLSQSFSL